MMLLEFDRTTPVVDFGATSSPLRWESRRWFLWPAFAYRMMLPGSSNLPFNIIQRGVLEICRAGVRDIESISKRLALPLDLVRFVIEQLRGMDVLDDTDSPTPRALRLLDESNEPSKVEESGYVFVDGHNLRLWPRIHRGILPVVEADFDQGKPRFQRGTQGKPETVFATVAWPTPGTQPSVPTTFEVQKAARHHARRMRAFRREALSLEDIDDTLNGLKSRGLRLIGTDPEPIFVAVCVFLPKNTQQKSWLVTDPCGLGVSDVLRHEIAKLAKEGKHNVANLLEEVAGQALRVDEDDLAAYLTEATNAAMDRVTQRLGKAAKLLPRDVLERLADADVRLEGARTAKPLEDFLGNAYAALESVFGWLVSLYPDPRLSSVLGSMAPENARLLHKVAEQLGFNVSQDILRILNVSRGAVKGAIEHGNKTLPGCLAAALLAAQHESNHPLVMLAIRSPDALEFLAEIGRPRIDASHFTSTVATSETALQIRDRMFSFLRNLLGTEHVETEEVTATSPWGAELLLRIRAQAEKATEEYPGLEDYPDLRMRVIEMHDAALLVKLLAKSTETKSETLKTRLRDAMVRITIVMEATFAEIEKVAPTPPSVAQAISNDRKRNAEQLMTAASVIGFTLDSSGQLPQSFTHAKAQRIRRVARGQGETLSARVAAPLIAARQQQEHPLRELAKRAPNLLLEISRLVDARGHGDEVPQWVTAAVIEEIKGMVANTVRTVIDVID
jgi:hypothetical protein